MTTHSSDELTLSGAGQPGAIPGLAAERHYLVVFRADTSQMIDLRGDAELVIGRADRADLRLNDPSVSRRHAIIAGLGDGFTISDLDSQNGTLVNGESITGARRLEDGDELTIGIISLVFHSSARSSPRRRLLEPGLVRQRIAEEIERALRFGRSLCLLVVQLEDGDQASHHRAADSVGDALRLIDALGWLGKDQLVVILPETDRAGATEVAHRVLATLRPGALAARLGLAGYPGDGGDPEALLTMALAAATAAPSGDLAVAAAATVAVGDQQVIVADPAMIKLYELLRRLAASKLPVLVCGETGTGKELAARALHYHSERAGRPLVTLNCAAIQESLVEGELFGYERGAFTGATVAKVGLIETAAGGTLFLDEIGELSAAIQAKLLRVLESGSFTRVGDVVERKVDLRIVAATNRDLEAEVAGGRFRQDLFFRLSGATAWLPPLRDRRRELPLLAQRFLADACVRAGRGVMVISPRALALLGQHAWPGNIRELKNTMEYVAAVAADAVLEEWHLEGRFPAGGASPSEPVASSSPPAAGGASFRPIEEELREIEKRRMVEALAAADGNQTRAAQLIRMPLRTFVAKLKQFGLREGRKDG